MSEDVEETKQQITTRSGRSFGVGPVGDSGGLLSISGARPSASAVHLASSPPVESHTTQLGSEVGLTATTTTESTVSTVATQMDSPQSPVGSPPSSAPREAESNNIINENTKYQIVFCYAFTFIMYFLHLECIDMKT